MRKYYFLLVSFFSALSVFSIAQTTEPIQYSIANKLVDEHTVQISITANAKDKNIKLLHLKTSEADVFSSNIVLDSSSFINNAALQQWNEKGTITKEPVANSSDTLKYAADELVWTKNITLNNNKTADPVVIKAVVTAMYKQGDEFLTNEQKLKTTVQFTTANNANANDGKDGKQSLFLIFVTGLGAGLLALLTPCIYSMIPITVSFFTKRSKTRVQGLRNALYYSISIISIFTLLGFLITVIFGATALNNLATNWIANLIFFAIFLLFGFSFLGAFEITLPTKWTGGADSKANTSNFMGIFFMALTLVLVSFSCTGPFIGSLIPLITKGGYFGPLVGFAGFSIALALPFSFFAFFPSKLNSLGKAGGWLNAIKVCLGFLELALALKFLSNADLAKGWRILDREIFIALWVVIFILMGVYLLGKLKFHHDDELPKNDFGLPYLSVTRLMFAITAFAFAVYLIPGMWGAPLKGVSAFVPPMGTQDFNASSANTNTSNTHQTSSNNTGLPHPTKYYDRMRIYEPEVVTKYGMVTYFDYNEALAVAKKQHKPLMLDFTGINCVNCRKMEGEVWSNPEVMKRLKENFVIASLYVDVHNIDLPEAEQMTDKQTGKKIETLGDFNATLQVNKFGANTQPFYFFLDNNENKLVQEGYGYDPNIKKFIEHLDKVIANFKNK